MRPRMRSVGSSEHALYPFGDRYRLRRAHGHHRLSCGRVSSGREPHLMAPPVVGSGTLRRLRELDTSGHPVLSVYLDADSVGHPTPATGEEQLHALMARV